MQGITVRELKKLVDEQIKEGNGNKTVLISRDDEGNGFHTLYYGFTDDQADLDMLYTEGLFDDNNNPKTVVILG